MPCKFVTISPANKAQYSTKSVCTCGRKFVSKYTLKRHQDSACPSSGIVYSQLRMLQLFFAPYIMHFKTNLVAKKNEQKTLDCNPRRGSQNDGSTNHRDELYPSQQPVEEKCKCCEYLSDTVCIQFVLRLQGLTRSRLVHLHPTN